jgi:xylulokinase
MALDELRRKISVSNEMVVVGGGSRSKLWRQIYADLYKMRILKTNVDQQAAALGAAALAAVGAGLWKDYEIIDVIHKIVDVTEPDTTNVAAYEQIMPVFLKAGKYLAEIGDLVAALEPSRSS